MWQPRGVRFVLGAAGAAALAVLAGCSDKDIERSLGKQTAAAIESSYRVVDDPLIADYVDTMGHILVAHSRRQDIPYEFKVLETDIVNAAAVPWGYVYLTTGLLDFVQSEDELWAVTGHEIGHQVGRDSVKAVKENILLSLATILIGREAKVAGDIAEMGANLLQLKHSRQDETQADDFGTAVTYAAGYDPTAQSVFFQRLRDEIEKGNPSRLETLFLTHPPTKDRIERQGQKPEIAQTEAAQLVQVGTGYARRARYAEAIERLSRAVELDGSNVAARLLLGECHLVRGERELAAGQYAAALKTDSGLVSAQEGLRAAQAAPAAPEGTEATPEQSAAARAEMQGAADRVASAAASVESATRTLGKNLKPVSEALGRSTDALVDLGNRLSDFPEAARDVTITTGLAVADARESVCGMERMAAVLGSAATEAQRTTAAAGTVDHPLSETEAAILARSAAQLDRSAAEVEALVAAMPTMAKAVQSAGRVAENAAERVGAALLPGSSLAERQIAWDSVKLSQQRGEKTRDQAREAAARASVARGRSLVAEINTAGIVLGAVRARACDNLVAYYTQTDPEIARDFREAHGLGLGEAALLLAAAGSAQRPADALVALSGEELDVVAGARAAGANQTYVNLFLRFIADALAKETAG